MVKGRKSGRRGYRYLLFDLGQLTWLLWTTVSTCLRKACWTSLMCAYCVINPVCGTIIKKSVRKALFSWINLLGSLHLFFVPCCDGCWVFIFSYFLVGWKMHWFYICFLFGCYYFLHENAVMHVLSWIPLTV